jgi:hypothetical protein
MGEISHKERVVGLISTIEAFIDLLTWIQKSYRKAFCNPSWKMDNQSSLAVAWMEESSANL